MADTVRVDPHAPPHAGHAPAAAHAHPNYVKIWAILVVLLGVSVAGPFFGMWWLTLAAAFGVAVVKALMVAGYFMHLNIEKAYIKYLLLVILGLLLVLWAGVYPDVQHRAGLNWYHQDIQRPPAPAEHGLAPGTHEPAPAGHQGQPR